MKRRVKTLSLSQQKKSAPATSRNEAWIFLQSEENKMILQFQAFSLHGNGVREIQGAIDILFGAS